MEQVVQRSSGYNNPYLGLHIKRGKQRLQDFIERVKFDKANYIMEWYDLIRDAITDLNRQAYIQRVVEISFNQSGDIQLPQGTKSYIIGMFNSEYQRAIQKRNDFYFSNLSMGSEKVQLRSWEKMQSTIYSTLKNVGNITGIVKGPKGWGKTSMLLTLFEELHKKEPKSIFCSNIGFIKGKRPEWLTRITSDYALFKLRFEGDIKRRMHAAVDEAGIVKSSRHHWMSKESKGDSYLIPLTRKAMIDFYYIYQTNRQITSFYADFVNLIIEKEGKKVSRITMNDMEGQEYSYIFRVNDTTLKFDSASFAFYGSYLNLEELWPMVTEEFETIEDTSREIKRIINNKDELHDIVHESLRKRFYRIHPDLRPSFYNDDTKDSIKLTKEDILQEVEMWIEKEDNEHINALKNQRKRFDIILITGFFKCSRSVSQSAAKTLNDTYCIDPITVISS